MKTVVKFGVRRLTCAVVIALAGLGCFAAAVGTQPAEGASVTGTLSFNEEKGDFGAAALSGKGAEMRAVKPGQWESYPELSQPDAEHYRPGARIPITELRLVKHDGEYHYADNGSGTLLLTDWWYEEYIVGYRNLTAQPLNPPPPPVAEGRWIWVDVKAKSNFGNFKGSFKIQENQTSDVEMVGPVEQKNFTAHFDGYTLDLGLPHTANMDPRFRGQWQNLGSGNGLRDVKVMIMWRDQEWGHTAIPLSPDRPRGLRPPH